MSRLVTTRELAELFQVDRRTVHRWEHYEGFPGHFKQPTDHASYQNFYDLEAVKAWAVGIGRWDDVVDLPTRRTVRRRKAVDPSKHRSRAHMVAGCEECQRRSRARRQRIKNEQQLNKEQAA